MITKVQGCLFSCPALPNSVDFSTSHFIAVVSLSSFLFAHHKAFYIATLAQVILNLPHTGIFLCFYESALRVIQVTC